VQFSPDLRARVLAGELTVSYRLWSRPQVKAGGTYRVGDAAIVVDEVELVPFGSLTDADVREAGEPDREALRSRVAHAGPVTDDTWVHRVTFHLA
jgi:hypothetical protein